MKFLISVRVFYMQIREFIYNLKYDILNVNILKQTLFNLSEYVYCNQNIGETRPRYILCFHMLTLLQMLP